MILCSLVHQLGEIALPMESECVDDQQALKTSAIVPSTPPVVRYIPEFVDRLSVVSLDIQMASTPLQLLTSLMSKELALHVVIPDHTYGHWLQISEKIVAAVRVKVVRVPPFLLEAVTTVNQDTVVLIILQGCTAVTLSGMVHSVRVKVVAAALLHGSLWI